MPVFILAFVEELLGPKLAKYAKPLIYVLAIILLVVGFGVAKCTYDSHVIKNNQTKIEQRAKPATDRAASERASDAIAGAKQEEEAHNVIHSVPDAVPAGPSHALACKRLRDHGRHPTACG